MDSRNHHHATAVTKITLETVWAVVKWRVVRVGSPRLAGSPPPVFPSDRLGPQASLLRQRHNAQPDPGWTRDGDGTAVNRPNPDSPFHLVEQLVSRSPLPQRAW